MSFIGYDRAEREWENRTPNDEHDCPLADERDEFQSALDEINEELKTTVDSLVTLRKSISGTVDRLARTNASSITDSLIGKIRDDLVNAHSALVAVEKSLAHIQNEADKR